MAVAKELYTDWLKGAVGTEFTKFVLDASDELISEMVSRKTCDAERDMWIRGALHALDVARSWEPEFIEEEQQDGV